jgi:hypothetical protein
MLLTIARVVGGDGVAGDLFSRDREAWCLAAHHYDAGSDGHLGLKMDGNHMGTWAHGTREGKESCQDVAFEIREGGI